MIAAVLFDLGGTLLDYGGPDGWVVTYRAAYQAVYDVLAERGHRGDRAAFHDHLFRLEVGLWEEAKAGRLRLTVTGVMAELLRSLDLPPDEESVARAARAYGQVLQATCVCYPDSRATLAALRARGLRLGLISNTVLPGELHVADLARFELLEHFDDLVFSSDVGLWKPQASVFRHALARLGLAPAAAVFVGDRLVDDVGGAQAAGLRGVLRVQPDGDDYATGAGLGIRPDARIESLAELPAVVERLAAPRCEGCEGRERAGREAL